MLKLNSFNPERPLSITLTAEDLTAIIQETVNKTIRATKEVSKQESVKLLSPEQVQERLNVTRATLWRWDKQGYLKAVKFGNRVRYKESDVDNVEAAENGRKGK